MKKFALTFLSIILYFTSMAVYDGHSPQAKDTVYISDGAVTGQIIDIKQNKLIILTSNNNKQVISLARVKRISLSRNLVPRPLLNQKITYKKRTLRGRLLYVDMLNSDVLFLDAKNKQVIRLPLLETSLAGKNLKKFYQSSYLFGLFLGLGAIGEILAKYFTPAVIYLIAAVLLLTASVALYLFFGRHWLKYKKSKADK